MAEDNTRDFPRENLVRAVMDGGVEFRDVAREGGSGSEPNDGRLGTLYGRFTPLGDWTEINSSFEGNFMERFSDGSLKKTVKENTGMRVLFQHGRDPQIGDKPLGPIESLSADSSYVVKLVDTSYNRDLLPLLKEDILGASFRFGVVKEEWRDNPGVSDYNPKGLPERTVTEARVMEFGPVTFPAYAGASAGVRSLTDEFMGTPAQTDTVVQTSVHLDGREVASSMETLPMDGRKARVELLGVGDFPATSSAAANVNLELRSPLTSANAPLNLEPDTVEEDVREEEIPEPAVEATPEVKDEEPEHSVAPSRATPEPDKQPQTSGHKEKKMDHQFRTVEEIDARLIEIDTTQGEMSAEWGVRAFDPDTQTTWDELIEEKERLKGDRTAYLERKAYLESQSKITDAVERGAGHPVAVANRNSAPDNVFDMGEYHTRSTSQEHMSRLLEEGAHRAIDGFRYPDANVDQAKASEAAEQILNQDSPDKEIAQRVLVHGSPTYRSAFWKTLAKQPLNSEEQRKMYEGMQIEARALTAAGDGGITVPVQIDPTVILSSNGAINPFRQVSKLVRTTSYQWQGVTSTGVVGVYRAEAATMVDGAPTLVAPTITPERADVFVPYTWEAAQDWASLEGEMAAMFADAKDVLEATKFASGAGHASNEPQGVLVGAGTVVGSSATTTVGTVDIYALEAALPVRFQPNAVWLATPALFSRIRSQAALGSNSGGIWADSLQVGQPARLLGYPAYKASSVGTAGNLAVSVASTKWGIFGDFSKFAIVDRIGFQVRPIDNLVSGNTAGGISYPNGMSGLVGYWRNSSGVLASNAFRVGTVT